MRAHSHMQNFRQVHVSLFTSNALSSIRSGGSNRSRGILSFSCSFYWPQRSFAKVMFLQASVILSTGEGLPTVHAGTHPPKSLTPQGANTPLKSRPPSPQELVSVPGADTPQEHSQGEGKQIWHTVNERPVRILLECILVGENFAK